MNNWKYDIFDGEWSLLNDARDQLRDLGITVSYFTNICESLTECDTLFLSSRFFAHTEVTSSYLDQIAKLRLQNENLVWFDMRDSAGTTQFEVLPLVKKYVKKQFYKDQNFYLTPPYGGRAFTEFYHKEFGVVDDKPYQMHPLDHTQKDKLILGWNIGVSSRLAHSRGKGHSFHRISRRLTSEIARFKRSASKHSKLKPVPTGIERPINIFAVLGTSYERNTVSFQRTNIIKRLASSYNRNCVIGGNVTRQDFNRHLVKSKIVISSFGWGEVCYREFEATWAGAAFAMPDMSGIETWPNIYDNDRTYIPLAWDLNDIEKKLDWAIDKPDFLHAITDEAQKRLCNTRSQNGLEDFASKISKLLI